ncbi:MAG TPA: hypothetical protein VE959_08015 [Bryobacteraceae bacterium]|nr:hypothetical protein [Bryobacteraceae bacterium]
MRGLSFVAGIALLTFCPPAHAQSADAATQELIQKLLARIDSLEKRVSELEQEKGAHAAVAAPAARPATADIHATHDQAPVPEAAQPTYPSLKIAGFGDFDFAANSLHAAAPGFGAQTLLGAHSGFQDGQFVLHMSSALSQKVSVFSEVSLTARSDAGTGTPPAPGFNAEVERMVVRYDLDDYFKISFGRYHTPINYWNTAFHHGQWLQTTISRPEMTQFGGSFIPVHFIGSLVEGAVPAGGLNLNYDLGLGNGRGAVISRGGDLGDINNNRAWLANVFVKPDSLYGLQVGGSVYHDKLNPLTAPAAYEWIESAHVVWHKETPELIAEFANVRHEPVNAAGAVTSNSQAFYIQTAYRLPSYARLWKPYYRFEYIHVPRSDAVFRAVPSFSASTMGVRYDITSFAAFKAEYRHYTVRALPAFNGTFLQTSFTF